jgi:hypothetical protein
MAKSDGYGEAGISIKVETEVRGTGKVSVRLSDGSEIERGDQGFLKIDKERLAAGDWLINGLTQEIYRFVGFLTDPRGKEHAKLMTPEGQCLTVPWEEVPETLLLVVNP